MLFPGKIYKGWKILHDRRSRRSRQISSLVLMVVFVKKLEGLHSHVRESLISYNLHLSCWGLRLSDRQAGLTGKRLLTFGLDFPGHLCRAAMFCCWNDGCYLLLLSWINLLGCCCINQRYINSCPIGHASPEHKKRVLILKILSISTSIIHLKKKTKNQVKNDNTT